MTRHDSHRVISEKSASFQERSSNSQRYSSGNKLLPWCLQRTHLLWDFVHRSISIIFIAFILLMILMKSYNCAKVLRATVLAQFAIEVAIIFHLMKPARRGKNKSNKTPLESTLEQHEPSTIHRKPQRCLSSYLPLPIVNSDMEGFTGCVRYLNPDFGSYVEYHFDHFDVRLLHWMGKNRNFNSELHENGMS